MTRIEQILKAALEGRQVDFAPLTLKDGIHPNEKGQNMMARMIISALKTHYIPFDGMNAII